MDRLIGPDHQKWIYASCRSSSDLFLVGNAQRSLDNWQISVPRGLATPCAVIWVIYWFLPPRFYPLGHPRGIFWAAIIFHQLIRLTWFFFVWEILSFPSTTIQFEPMHIVFFCSSYPYFDSRSIFSMGIFRVIGAQTPHVGSWGSKIFFSKFQNIGFPKMYTCNEV